MEEVEYQSSWGWFTAADFFLGGTGASLFLISLILSIYGLYQSLIYVGLLFGIIFVIVGLIFLAAELGRRAKFVGVFRKPATSWLSRGAIFNVLFLVFGILYIAPQWFRWIPWDQVTSLGISIGVIGCIFAFLVISYPGFLLLSHSSIPFWNTAILPILFLLHSLAGGMGLLFIILTIMGAPFTSSLESLLWWQIMLLGFTIMFLVSHLIATSYSRLEARRAFLELTKGRLSKFFIVGVLFIGLIIPLLVTIYSYLARNTIATAASGVLVLVGAILLRYSMLAAGIYVELKANP